MDRKGFFGSLFGGLLALRATSVAVQEQDPVEPAGLYGYDIDWPSDGTSEALGPETVYWVRVDGCDPVRYSNGEGTFTFKVADHGN